jgi:hypothetical protein
MTTNTLPSVVALEANDDDKLAAELRLLRLRTQAAIVRTLAHHIERFARPEDAEALHEQLAEEMTRLGRGPVEGATADETSPAHEQSGVFLRRGATAGIAAR